jgi:NADPH:quinone reductase-like Zn-dependent oxidoreductase
VASDGEAVVTVTAAALKPSDRWMPTASTTPRPGFPRSSAWTAWAGWPMAPGWPFFAPQRPYGGMAEPALVRRGMWFRVPDGVDDVTAAAVTNPGMAAWKTLFWEGELAAGQTVLVLGATGTSGRIATQLAKRHGARVAAGRNQQVLVQLLARGADAAVRVDRPREELVAAIADEGPYDLIVDYLWGAPAEAVFAALPRAASGAGDAPRRIRYIQVGIAAGEVAALPAITLRSAPVQLFGSGIGGPVALEDAAAAYEDLLRQVATGDISLDVEPAPLAKVEQVWPEAGSDRRIVFVP